MKTNPKNIIKTALLSSIIIMSPSCDSDDFVNNNLRDDSEQGSKDDGKDSGKKLTTLTPGDMITFNVDEEQYTVSILSEQLLGYKVVAGSDTLEKSNIPFTFTRDGDSLNINSPLTTVSNAEALAILNAQLKDKSSALNVAVANASDPATDAELEAVVASINALDLGVVLDYDGKTNVFVVTTTNLNGTIGGNGTLEVRGPVILLTDQGSLIYEGFDTGYTDQIDLNFTPTSSQ